MSKDVLLIDILAVVLPELNVFSREGKIRDVKKLSELLDAKEKGNSLIVPIQATHSGTIVNHRVYPGVHMRDSVGTWLHPFAKPFTDGHPERGGMFGGGGDPEKPTVLGRVKSAEFHKLVSERELKNDFKNPGLRNQGSGFIQVDVNLVDGEAIERVTDQRILTVSSGQRTKHMFCSVCAQDWLSEDGFCEHRPGRVYQVPVRGSKKDKSGKSETVAVKAFLITGRLEYDHLAAVMSPAQPHAQVMKKLMGDSQFDLHYDGQPIETPEIEVLTLIDSNGGEIFLSDSPETLERFQAEARTNRVPTLTCVAFDELPPSDDEDDDMAGKKPKKPGATDVDPQANDDQGDGDGETGDGDTLKTFTDEELAERLILASIFDAGFEMPNLDGDETEEDLRALADELNQDDYQLTDEQMESLWDGEVPDDVKEDAALTTKQRKKLSSEVFCGPNRSFPVNDCARAANAKSRLPQSNLSASQKKTTLSCINRRAKAMNCFVSPEARRKSGQKPNGGRSSRNSQDMQIDPTATAKIGAWKGAAQQDTTADPDVESKTDVQALDKLEKPQLIAEVNSLKAQLKSERGSVNTLVEENVGFAEELRDLYANQIYQGRLQLGRAGVPAKDTEKDFGVYMDDLTGRSLEYLRDASDEVNAELEAGGGQTTTTDNNSQGVDGKPIVHPQTSPGTTKDGKPDSRRSKRGRGGKSPRDRARRGMSRGR